MAAPEYVPKSSVATAPYYEAPDVVPDSWDDDRAGSLNGQQPTGPMLGYQGPDQGYALTLARHVADRLVLTAGESADDVLAGIVQIALKRASMYGRAPVIHDLNVALELWGYVSEAPADLVAERSARFEGVANTHHWTAMRALVACVPDSSLRQTPADAAATRARDWRSQLEL